VLEYGTPAKVRHILTLNDLIHNKYDHWAPKGMIVRDQHWLSKPIAMILAYNFEWKEQWVESVQLA
jgi:hypothetical protein